MLTPTFRMENEEPVFKETRLSFSNNRAIKNSTKLDKNTKNKKMDIANFKKGNIDKLTKIDEFDKSEQSILKKHIHSPGQHCLSSGHMMQILRILRMYFYQSTICKVVLRIQDYYMY